MDKQTCKHEMWLKKRHESDAYMWEYKREKEKAM